MVLQQWGNQSCVALTPGLEIIIDADYPARQSSTPPECAAVFQSPPAQAGDPSTVVDSEKREWRRAEAVKKSFGEFRACWPWIGAGD